MRIVFIVVMLIFSINPVFSCSKLKGDGLISIEDLRLLGLELNIDPDSDSTQFVLIGNEISRGLVSVEFALMSEKGGVLFSQYVPLENKTAKALHSFRSYDLKNSTELLYLIKVDCAQVSPALNCEKVQGEFMFRANPVLSRPSVRRDY